MVVPPTRLLKHQDAHRVVGARRLVVAVRPLPPHLTRLTRLPFVLLPLPLLIVPVPAHFTDPIQTRTDFNAKSDGYSAAPAKADTPTPIERVAPFVSKTAAVKTGSPAKDATKDSAQGGTAARCAQGRSETRFLVAA